MKAGAMRLRDKVAIVTGTGPNICGGIAEVMAMEGASIACIDLDPANAQDCARAIERSGHRAVGVPCDVTDEAQVQRMVSQTRAMFGRIDIVVNGAVMYNMKGIRTMSVAEFRRQVDIILTGSFLVTKYAVEHMIERAEGGSVIHIASTEAHQGNPRNVAYCSAKAGILNMTRANAVELAPYRIRVNSLTPTATDPHESVDRAERWGRPRWDVSDSLALRRAALLPLGRAPSPSDYAHAAVFLASNEAQFITGTDLRVDAGAVAQYWGASQQSSAD
jgi:NAD(P)-dependent dehydrogenase (short-subunit alcohol dehydrogenase family)